MHFGDGSAGHLGCIGCAHLAMTGLANVDLHLFESRVAPVLVIPMWGRICTFNWDPDLAI